MIIIRKDFSFNALNYPVDGDFSNWAEEMLGIFSMTIEIGTFFYVNESKIVDNIKYLAHIEVTCLPWSFLHYLFTRSIKLLMYRQALVGAATANYTILYYI
jgi:hypothetical protein